MPVRVSGMMCSMVLVPLAALAAPMDRVMRSETAGTLQADQPALAEVGPHAALTVDAAGKLVANDEAASGHEKQGPYGYQQPQYASYPTQSSYPVQQGAYPAQPGLPRAGGFTAPKFAGAPISSMVTPTCDIPLWKVDDFACEEFADADPMDHWIDSEGNDRIKMQDGMDCTVRCPNRKWYQTPDVVSMLCLGGQWSLAPPPTTKSGPNQRSALGPTNSFKPVRAINCTTATWVWVFAVFMIVGGIGAFVVIRRKQKAMHAAPPAGPAGEAGAPAPGTAQPEGQPPAH